MAKHIAQILCYMHKPELNVATKAPLTYTAAGTIM